MTDTCSSDNDFLDRYPHQFFLLLNVMVKQPYFADDNEGKTFALTLLENIHEKAFACHKITYSFRTKYKTVLNIIVNYSQTFMSAKIFKNISLRLTPAEISSVLKANVVYSDLMEAYIKLCDYLDILFEELTKISSENNSTEWSNKDVLVGALKNRKQLDVCLKYKFYHVPVESLSLININVNYIAIYQSKRLFGDFSGIRYWGKVVKCELVYRHEIKEIPSESDKKYYRFTVDKWQTLYPPIESDGSGTVFCFTNLMMLLNAGSVNELYFADEDEFKLYNAIRRGIIEELDNVAYRYKDSILTLKDGMINVYRDKRLIYAASQTDYMQNIGGNFLKIKKLYKK